MSEEQTPITHPLNVDTFVHPHSLISGGGDAAGSVVIHDTRKPKEESTGVYSCPVVASTFGS